MAWIDGENRDKYKPYKPSKIKCKYDGKEVSLIDDCMLCKLYKFNVGCLLK